jgi:hypothetical protein
MAQVLEEYIVMGKRSLGRSVRELDKQDIFSFLAGQHGRILCPLCNYTSPKNKMSAFVKGGFFKCMACGVAKRLGEAPSRQVTL